jgi:ABC-type polysaccharide/polyol phosphate export permease
MIRRIVELGQYRELIKNLVIRDLKVRYKNSVLGVLWSLLNPLLMTLVFTVVFTLMLPRNSQPNYPVFFLCGFLPWSFNSATISAATGSIVSNANIIKKVYFPREILPLADVLANLVHFLVALVVLFGMILVSGIRLTPAALMMPLILLAQVMFTTGIAFVLSAANVFYRDTKHILQVVVQAWFFLTPVFYPIDILPKSKELLGLTIDIQLWARRLNPMASIIASYRDVLYRGVPTGLDFFFRTFVTCAVVLVLGYAVFCRVSSVFGEEV